VRITELIAVCVRCTLLQPENNSTQRVQLGSRYFHGKGVKEENRNQIQMPW